MSNKLFAQNIDTLQNSDTINVEIVSSTDNEIGLTLSAKYSKDFVSEIGLTYGSFQYVGYWPLSTGFTIGSEFIFTQNMTFGPKINGWIQVYPIELNGNLVYYFDNNGYSSVKFRPEIGYGFHKFSLTYGININLWRNSPEILGLHQISIKYTLRLKQMKYTEYDRNGNLIKW